MYAWLLQLTQFTAGSTPHWHLLGIPHAVRKFSPFRHLARAFTSVWEEMQSTNCQVSAL